MGGAVYEGVLIRALDPDGNTWSSKGREGAGKHPTPVTNEGHRPAHANSQIIKIFI